MRAPRQVQIDEDAPVADLQSAVREWAEDLRAPELAGKPLQLTADSRVSFGDFALFDGRQALSAILPVPVAADTGKSLVLALVGGAGALTAALGGATVDGATTYSLSADYASAKLIVVGKNKWLAR